MKHLAWLTDIHLDFLRPPEVGAFPDLLAGTEADTFAISSDIAQADDVAGRLHDVVDRVNRPVYFVLGNHDFYRGSIADVREKVRARCAVIPNLHWMPDAGVVPFTDETCLVGHEGLGDGRFGGFDEDPALRIPKLHALGDEAASHLRSVLPDALARFRHVVVVTHVPPFRESCWLRTRPPRRRRCCGSC